MIENIKGEQPIIKVIKTHPLAPNKTIRTDLIFLFMDAEIFQRIVSSYIMGEVSTIEMRIGTTIKHPEDKYDRAIALQEAAKKLKKAKFSIHEIRSLRTQEGSVRTVLSLHDSSPVSEIILKDGRIHVVKRI